MQTTVREQQTMTPPMGDAPKRVLTTEEINEHFMDLELVRQKLLEFVHEFYSKRA